jgi:hypothetical protein
MAASVGDYSFGWMVVDMVAHKSPFSVALAVFVTFGPIIVILIDDWRNSVGFLKRHQYLAAFLVANVGIAYVGGSDTERLLFWSTPVVYASLGHSLWRRRADLCSIPLLSILVVAQAVSCRLFWAVPSPGSTSYFNLWSYRADHHVRLLHLITYVCFSIALLVWIRQRRRLRTASRAASSSYQGDVPRAIEDDAGHTRPFNDPGISRA